MNLLQHLSGYIFLYDTIEKDMCKEFSKRKEQARELYWNACKLPRKQKKKIRKQAKKDFEIYSVLEKPLIFI